MPLGLEPFPQCAVERLLEAEVQLAELRSQRALVDAALRQPRGHAPVAQRDREYQPGVDARVAEVAERALVERDRDRRAGVARVGLGRRGLRGAALPAHEVGDPGGALLADRPAVVSDRD